MKVAQLSAQRMNPSDCRSKFTNAVLMDWHKFGINVHSSQRMFPNVFDGFASSTCFFFLGDMSSMKCLCFPSG